MVEVVFGGMDDLLGGQGATGMTAHAVGDDRKCHAVAAGVRQYGHAILLFFAIPLVLRCACVYGYRHPLPL
jgi:hypothetical protein